MESFSKTTKTQLEAEEIKKKCCRHTFADVQELKDKKSDDNSEKIAEIYEKCRCEGCKSTFVRGLFLLYGSVTDPKKQYHLDFSFRHEHEAEAVSEILARLGFDFHKTVRRERHVLYIKESAAIEDFLVFIGAQAAAFEIMNSKIVREISNSANRQVNCDTANIEKSLSSRKKYAEAVKKLTESGKINTLSDELRETARLVTENEQYTLTDLGRMLNPPVSKSGVRHRLLKILEYARLEDEPKR